jgi:cytochrome c oxidase accessory protein FixG
MGRTTLIDRTGGARGGSEPPGGAVPPHGDPGEEEPLRLYQARKQIYPKLVSGRFRTVKWFVLVLALVVYYGLPWLRWERGPGAADQAVLADFAGGRFYFFSIEIWPQEVYYITGLLILAAIGLFLVTALFGRVWCGYACPQTVWTDLFIAVERFFEGDRNARMKLDKGPWTLNKLARKAGKHSVWLLIAFATGGAWILYWHDAPTLARTFFVGQAETSAYVFAAILTGTTYALAGTMREQVCTYMCPWPRVQAALIDKSTLAVTYRADRGEPRGPHRKGESWEGRGDCIDCKQCVVVCPQGIDIRDGLQLECIHCALCIDACDAVMKKVGRPAGLIAYDTDENVELRAGGRKPRMFNPFRSRTVVYSVVLAATAGVMLWGLATRSTLDLNVLKDRSVPYVRMSNGDIRNGYTVKLVNKRHADRALDIRIDQLPGARIEIIGETGSVDTVQVMTQPDGVDRFRVLVTAPAASLAGTRRSQVRFTVSDPASGETASNTVPFLKPER